MNGILTNGKENQKLQQKSYFNMKILCNSVKNIKILYIL